MSNLEGRRREDAALAERLEGKVDAIASMMDQAKGVLNLLRWLGAGGTFAAIGALVWVAMHTHS